MESVSSVFSYYNVLAQIIPGMLYLYAVNEMSRLAKLPYVDIKVISGASIPPALLTAGIVIFIFAAFVISNLLEPLATRILNFTIGRRNALSSLERLNRIYPQLKLNFSYNDIDLLHTIVRQRSQEIAHLVEQYQALGGMLRNLALGFYFVFFIEVAKVVVYSSWSHAFIGVFALFLGLASTSRSSKYRNWSYSIVFESALEYGSNLEEVVENSSYRLNKLEQAEKIRTKKIQPRNEETGKIKGK